MNPFKKLFEFFLFFFGYIKLEDILRISQLPHSIIKFFVVKKRLKLITFKKKSKFIKLKDFKRIKDEISKSDYIFNIKVDDHNFKMNFNGYPINGAISERIDGKREEQTTAILKSIISPTMNVLEIGSCYGYFTNIISDMLKSDGRLVAIEGTPNNFKILTNNVEINKLSNTELYNHFVDINFKNENIYFDKNDINPYFAYNPDNDTINKKSIVNKIKVTKILLTSFLNKINFSPDLIFMDIEGYELQVIEDLFLNKLKVKPKYILFEIHNQFYPRDKPLEYLLNKLHSNNYSTIEIDDKILCKLN